MKTELTFTQRVKAAAAARGHARPSTGARGSGSRTGRPTLKVNVGDLKLPFDVSWNDPARVLESPYPLARPASLLSSASVSSYHKARQAASCCTIAVVTHSFSCKAGLVYRLSNLSGLYFHLVLLKKPSAKKDGCTPTASAALKRGNVVLVSPPIPGAEGPSDEDDRDSLKIVKGIEANHPLAIVVPSDAASNEIQCLGKHPSAIPYDVSAGRTRCIGKCRSCEEIINTKSGLAYCSMHISESMEMSRRKRSGLLSNSRVLVGAPPAAAKGPGLVKYDFNASYLLDDGRVVSIRGDRLAIGQGQLGRVNFDGTGANQKRKKGDSELEDAILQIQRKRLAQKNDAGGRQLRALHGISLEKMPGADSVFSQDVLRDLGFNPVTGKDYIHHRQDTGPESTPLDEPEQEVKCPGKISKDGGGLTENDGVIVFSSSP